MSCRRRSREKKIGRSCWNSLGKNSSSSLLTGKSNRKKKRVRKRVMRRRVMMIDVMIFL